jgi:hypothetical protein
MDKSTKGRTPMTQITTETCFDDANFPAWWNEAYDYIMGDSYIEHIMGCPDDGWCLDCLVDSYNKGMTPSAAVNEAVDGYDPTP